MFGSLVGMLSKLKESKTVQTLRDNIADNYHKLKDQVLRNYEITEILPQIYHVAFPEPETIALLKAHIGKREFQIWNVSEYRYQAEVERELQLIAEQGDVQHLCLSMYSNVPFYQLVLAINSIHRFTQARDTRVYVHCQDGRIRSALLLACYIYRRRLAGVEDISEAILFVNRALGVRLDQPEEQLHKNMHLLLRNFVNYLHDFNSINKTQLKLLKIIVNNPPKLQVKGWNESSTRISLEMRCGEDIAFKTNYDWEAVQGNILCATISKKMNLLSDEFLLIVKYLFEGKAYNVFRIQLNTNFIYQCFSRVQQHDIDTADFAEIDPNQFMHVDFMFEEGKEWSHLASLQQGGLHEEGESGVVYHEQPHSQQKQQSVVKVQSKVEDEVHEVHEQAIASLNEGIGELVDQDSTTIDIVQEINQKLSQSIKAEEAQQDRPDDDEEQEEEEEEDLDDYMSKLQSQA